MDILAYRAETQGESVKLTCSDGRQEVIDNWDGLITFLLMSCDMAVVYHLGRFVDTIATLFPAEIQKELQYGGRVFLPNHEKLYYQPNRMFGITYANKETNIYGLSRYSDEEITDVDELVALAQRVVKTFGKFGVKATKLSSPISVYADVLHSLSFPRASDLPDEALEMTNQCAQIMSREWRELYKVGHWDADNITDMDINNCYGSIIAQLPELRQATFFESDTIPSEFSWGVLSGNLKIFKPVSPFSFVGEHPELITTEMLGLFRQYGIGDMDVGHGWFLQLPKYYAQPFQNVMQRLYKQRGSVDALESRIAKAIIVGIGGRFSQKFFNKDGSLKRLGDDFNSIYSAMMTSRATIKVCDFIYRNHLEDRIVSVLVDGCLVEGDRVEVPESGEMGAWRANPPSPALVVSLFMQWMNGKRPLGLTYDDVMGMIEKDPSSSVYKDIDLNLMEHGRSFKELPRIGEELLAKKYESEPFEAGHGT